MFLICVASAMLALMSSSTINDLEGMFNLKGMLNYTTLYLIIGVGGVGLIVANFFLAEYSGKLLNKMMNRS
jgi:cytochrome c oxidase subunit IV